MKNLYRISYVVLLLFIFFSCTKQAEDVIKIADLTPWCIVNFDSLERSPSDRIAMLKEMGFTKYGYNWDVKHLDQMKEEFALASENNMEIVSIFLWLNAKRDSIGKLSPSNQRMLNIISEVKNKPTIWLSFSNNYFEDRTHEESISLAVEFIKFIKSKTDKMGSKIALYNHRGWFGNPHHQIEIIELLPQDSLKMVYNFHHAHHYLDEFSDLAKKMKPYLSYVTINGMRQDGPEILTIGEGDYEQKMIQLLIDEGFNGPWGILGHIKTEDVHKVLERNVNGLKSLEFNRN
ncbi:MAG: hypothetical protein HKN90_04840 [Flavobacteriaceae bacterium]|nr:hypothetical protein [Flavobacteriaceae bacterium]